MGSAGPSQEWRNKAIAPYDPSERLRSMDPGVSRSVRLVRAPYSRRRITVASLSHHLGQRRAQVIKCKWRKAEHHAVTAGGYFHTSEQHVGAQDRHAHAVDLGDPARVVGVVQ